MDGRPRVLIVVDRIGWAYDVIANNIIRLLKHKYKFDKKTPSQLSETKHENHDLVLSMGWKYTDPKNNVILKPIDNIPIDKHVGVIHSIRTINDCRSVASATKYIARTYCATGIINRTLYSRFHNDINNLVLTENGVDTMVFNPMNINNKNPRIVLGWSGRGRQSAFRGLDLIAEAACICDSTIEFKMLDADREPVYHGLMPDFYNSLDCYINASESEGCSLTILEAAACGIPIIATKVGAAEDIIQDGITGFLINRDVPSIVSAFKKLSKEKCKTMGNLMAKNIKKNWSWEAKIGQWDRLIQEGLNG